MSIHQPSHPSPRVSEVDAAWHVSTYSTNGAGQCVEAGLALGFPVSYAIRDSQNRAHGTLVLNTGEWTALLASIKTANPDL